MSFEWVSVIFILAVVSISNYFYKHSGKTYAEGKTGKIETPSSFGWVYRYLQISTLIFSFGSLLTTSDFFLTIHRPMAVMLSGMGLTVIGLGLFVTAKMKLGNHYSPCFDAYLPNDIVQEGLYRFIRHPIYSSNIILMLGLFLLSGSLWVAFNTAVLWAFYWISARKEEEAMTQLFPGYKSYIRKTDRFFPVKWLTRGTPARAIGLFGARSKELKENRVSEN